PGAPFEIVQAEVGGVPMRVWKNAPRSLRTLLEASLAYGERPFLIYEDKRLSYAEHGRRATLLANALMRQFGVAKGDRVAIAMRNYPEWSVAFWAATAVGAVAVPLNAWWTGPELEYGLSDSGSKVLIADAERIERLAPHLEGLGLTSTMLVRAP